MSCVIRITARSRSCCSRADQFQDLRLRRDVQRRRRFVGDQHARLGGERQRDHHPLAQAAGQFERIRIDPLRRPGNADHRQQLDRPRPRARASTASRAGGSPRSAGCRSVWKADSELIGSWNTRPISPPRIAAHRRRRRAAASRGRRPCPSAPAQQDLAADDAAGAFDDAQDGARGDALAAAGLADDAERPAGDTGRTRRHRPRARRPHRRRSACAGRAPTGSAQP